MSDSINATAESTPQRVSSAVEVTLTALRVADLDRACAFYTEGCGLTRLHKVATDTFDAVIVGAADGRGAGIELIHERQDGATPDPGTGFAKLVLTVPDVAAATKNALAHGGSQLMAPQAMAQMGGLLLSMVRDTDGYTVEFIERRS